MNLKQEQRKLMAGINCDMGEGIGNDRDLMPFLSAANIACGYHAGDADTIRATAKLAMEYGVAIGAHPSFPDRKNFGRTEMTLSLNEIYDLVTAQIKLMQVTIKEVGEKLQHVKPHGALYNMSARNATIAATIARAVKDADPQLVLYGLSGSCSVTEAAATGLKTASEVFADRTYREDGSLTPRSQSGAIIVSAAAAVKQVLQMVNEQSVTTITGKIIPVDAQTICIHGDGANAIIFARAIHAALTIRQTGDIE